MAQRIYRPNIQYQLLKNSRNHRQVDLLLSNGSYKLETFKDTHLFVCPRQLAQLVDHPLAAMLVTLPRVDTFLHSKARRSQRLTTW